MLIEIAKGSLSNRGIIIPYTEVRKHINSKQSLFRSYFAFDERIKEHLKTRKSPSGYIGNFYLTDIILDVDRSGDSLLGTQQRLIKTLNVLIKDFELEEDNYIVWYSGTGFHIQIPDIFNFTVSPTLPQVVKSTIEHYFPEADTKPINSRGLIRVGFTLNEKSGLYKTPIPDGWLWSDLDEEKLKVLASAFNPHAVTYNKEVKTFEDKIIEYKDSKQQELPSHNPTNLVTCMQSLYNEGENRGSRHESIMRLTSWQRRNGTPLQATVAMLKQFAPSLDAYEIERIVTDVYNKNYQYGCNDKIMRKFCDTKCIFHKNKDYSYEIASSHDIEEKFVDYIRGDWKKDSFNFRTLLELDTDFWVQPGMMVTLIGGTGLNKGVRLDEDLPTPQGFRKAKDIKIGDELFGVDGKPVKVYNISPIHNKKNFKCTFDDGSNIIVDDDHLWEVEYWGKKRKKVTDRTTPVQEELKTAVKSTQELYNLGVRTKDRRKWSIPLTEPVEYPNKDLLVTPYYLGLWLGDGSINKPSITTEDTEIIKFIEDYAKLLNLRCTIYSDKRRTNVKTVSIVNDHKYARYHSMKDMLNQIGVLGNKHIPEDYLLASVSQRKMLLKGLMDSDGHTSNKTCIFSQSNKVLADQFLQLVRSLGIKARMTIAETTHKTSYRITFSAPFSVFHLSRKKNAQIISHSYRQTRRRWFESIKEVSSAPTICFSVDHPRELYLATKDYIVTHNTAFMQNIAVNERQLIPIIYVSTEFGTNLLFRRNIQIAHDMSKDEVEKYYMVNSNTLSNAINHIHYLQNHPNIGEIEKLVTKHNAKMLILDVVDDITVANYQHGVSAQEILARNLKHIAEKYSLIIFNVHHISKGEAFTESGLPKKLSVHSGKGSSAIEQKSDLVIGIEGKQNEPYRLVRSLKSRDNEPFEKLMKVDMETFKFYMEK